MKKELEDLQAYFDKATIPTEPVRLNKAATINNCNDFIKSHLSVAHANIGNPTYKPYTDRLKEFKAILENDR